MVVQQRPSLRATFFIDETFHFDELEDFPKGDLNENSFNKLQKECLQSTANYTSNTDISSGYDDQTCGILAPAQGLRGFVSLTLVNIFTGRSQLVSYYYQFGLAEDGLGQASRNNNLELPVAFVAACLLSTEKWLIRVTVLSYGTIWRFAGLAEPTTSECI